MQPQLRLLKKIKMKKPSEVFKNIRFAKLNPKHDKGHKGGSTDDEEHGAVSEIEWNQQLAHQKKRAMQEDLRKWFDKDHPEGGWKRINSKGEAIGPCAREPGEPKPKCMSNEKRAALSKKERASAVASKRKHDPNPERKGEPINVSNFGKGKISEDMENLEEKNVPTSPEKWAQAKAQAKAKFDVYPSAYANGWAAKKYKEMGGGWKSVSEEAELEESKDMKAMRIIKDIYKRKSVKEEVKDKFDIGEYDQEGDMAKSDLRSIMANAKRVHDMLEDSSNLPEWVQSKITLAEDYISTVANYMTSEMSEEVEQIDEISKQTLGSYVNKATSSISDKSAEAQHKRTKAAVDYDDNIRRGMSKKGADTHLNRGYDSAKPDINKVKSRMQGVQKAISRLTKEEVEQVEEGMMKSMATDAEETKRLGSWRKETPWMKTKATITDKSGAKHTPMSRARDLARAAVKKNVREETITESRLADIVREAAEKAKKKKKEETKKSEDAFQAEPELSSQIIRND
jgi:hypothetical protein